MSMREMRLKYFISLASNIDAKARRDAQVVEQANKQMQGAVQGTNAKLGEFGRQASQAGTAGERLRGVLNSAADRFIALDRAVGRFGANSSMERQIGYTRRLAQNYDLLLRKGRQLVEMAANVGSKLPGGVAAAVGTGYAINAALKGPMEYDTRLRAATATALAGRGVDDLRKGREEIAALVIDATRKAPGSTRDGTLGAFEKLVGSGSFSFDESKALLPMVMRTAVASGADANDLVRAAEKMKVNLGLRPDQIGVALSKVMRAGQEGGFEIKDAAKWIGPLMPYMKGYNGMEAVEQLVTMLQQVRSTAGTNDEAANNLRNFVEKMGADSTRKDFKKQGFDLDAEMAKGVLANQTPVETYMALLDKVMEKNDPEGKARAMMKNADKAATPEERDAQYERIKEIYQDSAVSKIIADLQEFGGYSGLRKTREYGKKVLAAVKTEDGNAVDVGFQFMTEGTDAKAKNLANEKDQAASTALEAVSGPLNKTLDGAAGFAKDNPKTAAAGLAATFLATVAGGLGWLFRRGGAASVAGGAGVGAPSGGAAASAPVAAGNTRGLFVNPPAAAAAPAMGLRGLLARMGLAGAGLSLAGDLFTTSDEEIAILKQAEARRRGGDYRLPENYRGKGFNDPRLLLTQGMDMETLLRVTAPNSAPQQAQAGQPVEVKIGEGVLRLDINVHDSRVEFFSTVQQPMDAIRIDGGNTNPGGLK